MSAEKASNLEPIIEADSDNYLESPFKRQCPQTWIKYEAVRTAGALNLKDFSPDAESPAG